jgi:hypothetical protein
MERLRQRITKQTTSAWRPTGIRQRSLHTCPLPLHRCSICRVHQLHHGSCNIVDIGLRIIKRCGMYAEEYKAWIACKAIHPRIVKTFDSFKTFWVAKITLVNQTAVPASQYGYGMAATNNDDSVVSYGEPILNFGTTYAATQESVKSQGTMIASMQNQLNAMSQYCMAFALPRKRR